jgi:hypothetical protein
LIPSQHWARNFSVTDADIEYLTGLLLERETPLSTPELARALIEWRIQNEADDFEARYRDVQVYNPAQTYEVGQQVVFPKFDYALATVTNVRAGDNVEYGDFSVIAVDFDNAESATREFAAALTTPHALSNAETGGMQFTDPNSLTADQILDANYDEIVGTLDEQLSETPELVILAGKWFPLELLLDVNDGHLFLADAVLDLAGGEPMDTPTILREIGGLGNGTPELQAFSLNYALSHDDRFDEVGPAGNVWWYLSRLEPEDVRETPPMLQYQEIDYDRSLLTPEMLALEAELDDELSPIQAPSNIGNSITITLNYPHRRVGTLPLNAKMRKIFPTAHRTQHISVRLVDAQDGEEYPGWVVRQQRYVAGLGPLYKKHKMPVGAYVSVRQGDSPEKIVVDFRAHRPRTEWIRLITPKNNQITFENHKRSIGAEYDDLMIVGVEDIAGVDALFQPTHSNRRNLTGLLRTLIAELSRLTPQGTVHAKTLYSAVNVFRRVPPGPIFATLVNEPDFENVGNHYWKLAGT